MICFGDASVLNPLQQVYQARRAQDYEVNVHAVNGWLDTLSPLLKQRVPAQIAPALSNGTARFIISVSAHANTAIASFYERIDTIGHQAKRDDTQ
jgi:hypothetical protein